MSAKLLTIQQEKIRQENEKILREAKRKEMASFILGLTDDYVGLSYADREVNMEEAVKFYTKATDLGHHKALVKLAQCYAEGTGVEANPEEAAKWYKLAADQACQEAQQVLSKGE